MTYYELVNISSGNLIGDFDTQAEALRDVWTYCQRLGRKALGGIALTQEDESAPGLGPIVAEGEDLAAILAERAVGPVSV